MCDNNRVTKPCEGKYCKLKFGVTRILENVHPRRRFCNYCQRMKEQEKKREQRGKDRYKVTGAKEAAYLRKCQRISLANNQMDE